eukprot:TRINITY_DN4885_c0_g1_i3.p1 TRINITY_DN4885_c0_g1~~TRINITY_DN4885_c0_g1_i3.p1  ORF type:complete len:493 (+),score=88.04 TRINITY_DN4885_c0_g1_i3:72-1550(+)
MALNYAVGVTARLLATPVASEHLPAAGHEGHAASEHSEHSEHQHWRVAQKLVLVVIVCLVLLFEIAYHSAVHKSSHGFKYGKQAAQKKGNDDHNKHGDRAMRHVNLWAELVFRIGGEFQGLGFVAFLIFVGNSHGLFTQITARATGNWLPADRDTLLHITEQEHIKLFLCMIVYFLIMSCVVGGSVRQIRQWEESDATDLAALEEKVEDSPAWEYCTWRRRFMEEVLSWAQTRPELYRRLVDFLCLGNVEEEEVKAALCNQAMRKRFFFGSYLSFNVEHIMVDSINLRLSTWLAMIAIFLLEAFLEYCNRPGESEKGNGRLGGPTLAYIILMPALMMGIMVCFWIYIVKHRRRLSSPMRPKHLLKSEPEKDAAKRHSAPGLDSIKALDGNRRRGCHQNINTDLDIMRVCQIVVVQVAYLVSSQIMEIYLGQALPSTYILGAVMLGLLLFCSFMLPILIPHFLAVMSMPPYLNDANLAAFFSAISHDNIGSEV